MYADYKRFLRDLEQVNSPRVLGINQANLRGMLNSNSLRNVWDELLAAAPRAALALYCVALSLP